MIGAVVAACAMVTAAHAADVKVTVEYIRSARGEIHVDVCDEMTFLGPNCPFDAAVPAHRGWVTLTVHGVPPGRYAVVAYHDANANHELDLNGFGIPKERFGFSNDPPMLLGPPLFKDSAFDVADKDVAVKVRLKR